MAKIIIIGGIESTFMLAEHLYQMGEEIIQFYTRGASTPGWEGVAMINAADYPFTQAVPSTQVNNSINDHIEAMRALQPEVIYSLGWQQIYHPQLLQFCPVVGIHESLLPMGAGACPIANAILHDASVTGVTLFYLDQGMDTGHIIGQLRGALDPRTANATELYQQAIILSKQLLSMYVPHINQGTAAAIPQDFSKRTCYGKIDWAAWPSEKVERAKVYPYG
jgi:methionyl-tRNA formyltransferase